MKKIILLSFLLTSALVSCDCYRKLSGTVTDSLTGKPIAGATVYNLNREGEKVVTDSSGYFEVSAIASGFNCPELKIRIEYAGYKSEATSTKKGEVQTIPLKPIR